VISRLFCLVLRVAARPEARESKLP
jgi:hypothetical protein